MRRFFTTVSLLALLPAAAQASPISSLPGAEQAYYVQVFDYAMEALKPGEHYDWASTNARGSIAVAAAFTSKSGATCRDFSESYVIAAHNYTANGTGCKRVGKDGWCKLHPGNAQTCALEPPSNLAEQKLRDASEAIDSTTPTINQLKSWWPF